MLRNPLRFAVLATILFIANGRPTEKDETPAQQLERMLKEQEGRARVDTSTAPTSTTIAANATNILTNLVKIIGEVQDVASDDSSTVAIRKADLGSASLPFPGAELQQFPGAELQFHETFSFLQPKPDPTTTKKPSLSSSFFRPAGFDVPQPQNNEVNNKQFKVFSVRFPDGNYTGELDSRGFRHGWGEMYFRNGSVYGPGGIFLYGEGDRYVGQWNNHSQHGKIKIRTAKNRVNTKNCRDQHVVNKV